MFHGPLYTPVLRQLTTLAQLLCLWSLTGCLTLKSDFTKAKCRTYVLYPPRHEDEKVSDHIANKWLSKTQVTPCDRIIDYEESKTFLTFMGAQNTTSPTKVLQDEAKRTRLSRRFLATHLIDLTIDRKKKDASLVTSVYALSPFKQDDLQDLPPTVPLSQSDLTTITRRHPWRKYFKAFNLLPNSIATGIGGALTGISARKDKKFHSYEQNEVSFLPTVLSAITLRNIQHRYQFDYFDVSATTYGSLAMSYIDNKMIWFPIEDPATFNADEIPQEDRLHYRVQGYFLAPIGGVELAAYSPIGTLALGLGLGPGVSGMQDTFQSRKWQTHLVVQMNFTYRFFLTERLFGTLWVNLNAPSPDLIEAEYFSLASQGYILLGLGYYFAESRSFVRKLF